MTRKPSTLEKGRKGASRSPIKKNGIVNAVLISSPDLSLYLKLQNLLNYFVDCMNNLTSFPDNHAEYTAHLSRCIEFISDLDVSHPPTFDADLVKMLDEFIEDARKFQALLSAFRDPQTASSTDQSAAVLLTAKALHLQWLSVCILEDLKQSHSRTG